jgi:hypothetical protein
MCLVHRFIRKPKARSNAGTKPIPIVIGLPPYLEVCKLLGTDCLDLHLPEELDRIALNPMDRRILRSTLASVTHRGDGLLPFLEDLLIPNCSVGDSRARIPKGLKV